MKYIRDKCEICGTPGKFDCNVCENCITEQILREEQIFSVNKNNEV